MNTAQIKGLRNLHNSTVTVIKTDAGFEVRKGGALQGVAKTLAGAKELASCLA